MTAEPLLARPAGTPQAAAERPARPARPPRPGLRALLDQRDAQFLLLTGSRDPNACVTLLVIPAGSAEPRLAVKIATTLAAAETVEAEARLLVALRRLSLGRVGATLPRHAGTYDCAGMLAAAASAVPGVPMITRYHSFRHVSRRGRVLADFAAARQWLAGLHDDSSEDAAPISLIDDLPERISRRWPDHPATQILARELPRLQARLAAAEVPRTVVHGDFWPGNLLMTGDRVTGVVDWASGQLRGDPLRDVARFALSYALYLDRHTRPGSRVAGHPGLRADGWGSGIRYAIAGRHWFGQAVREFVADALTRLGAPAALWRDVLLAGLAETAATADHSGFAALHRDLLARLLAGERA